MLEMMESRRPKLLLRQYQYSLPTLVRLGRRIRSLGRIQQDRRPPSWRTRGPKSLNLRAKLTFCNSINLQCLHVTYRWVLLKQNLFQNSIREFCLAIERIVTLQHKTIPSQSNNVVYMLLTDRGVHFFKLFVAVQLL